MTSLPQGSAEQGVMKEMYQIEPGAAHPLYASILNLRNHLSRVGLPAGSELRRIDRDWNLDRSVLTLLLRSEGTGYVLEAWTIAGGMVVGWVNSAGR